MVQNVDHVDAELNFVQRQYIQPYARLPGEAYLTTGQERNVTGEELTTADGGITYTTEYKPIRRGSLVLYEASGDEIEADATNYPTVDYDTGTLTFSIAEPDVTADYHNVVVADVSDVATDIYRIQFISDITTGTRWRNIPLLRDFDTGAAGIRFFNSKFYFHGVSPGRTFLVGYHKVLTDLSVAHQEPEIDERWHDLYWLGAIAMTDPDLYPQFVERLKAFREDRLEESRPSGQRIQPGGWW